MPVRSKDTQKNNHNICSDNAGTGHACFTTAAAQTHHHNEPRRPNPKTTKITKKKVLLASSVPPFSYESPASHPRPSPHEQKQLTPFFHPHSLFLLVLRTASCAERGVNIWQRVAGVHSGCSALAQRPPAKLLGASRCHFPLDCWLPACANYRVGATVPDGATVPIEPQSR